MYLDNFSIISSLSHRILFSFNPMCIRKASRQNCIHILLSLSLYLILSPPPPALSLSLSLILFHVNWEEQGHLGL